jgi:tRNA A58 N-methylase Trm61
LFFFFECFFFPSPRQSTALVLTSCFTFFVFPNPPRANVRSKTGHRLLLHFLRPTPTLWTTLGVAHRTQILYAADIAEVLHRLVETPSDVFVEAGTGSGSLTAAVAAAIHAPGGHIYTFEFDSARAGFARRDMAALGIGGRVTVTHRDVCRDGFVIEAAEVARAVARGATSDAAAGGADGDQPQLEGSEAAMADDGAAEATAAKVESEPTAAAKVEPAEPTAAKVEPEAAAAPAASSSSSAAAPQPVYADIDEGPTNSASVAARRPVSAPPPVPGPGAEHIEGADCLFLDVPAPWLAVPFAAKALRGGGRACFFSPCIEQVLRTREAMDALGAVQ